MSLKTHVKRHKAEDLPSEVLYSLIQWFIDAYPDYNSSESGGHRSELGTVKQRYWAKWAAQLELLGYPRTADQVKKKINGEVKVVRERLSAEKAESMKTEAGVNKVFPKLSDARQMLYDFLSVEDSATIVEEPEAQEEPVIKKPRPTVNDQPEPIDLPLTMIELRRELLMIELDTARINQTAAMQQYENALKEGKRLDMQVKNEKLKKELLLKECRCRGIELSDELDQID
uniref:Uncharacterized protein n=1 Tax=Caenorhabditis japonica TaxID=281687 RepID=A0A8R1E1Y8_CAEJA